MASLGVESLFANIPLNEFLDICIDDLFCDTNMIHNLDHNDMRELLTLAAYESFIFDQVMYRHIDSVAMDSPLGPILANAFSCHFEEVVQNAPPDILPFKDFVNYMNAKHPNIIFTLEFKENDSFSFLDVKITCRNN